MKHPNTVAAGLSGGAATFLAHALDRWAHVQLDPAAAAGLVTFVTAACLFVGRRGIIPTIHDILFGTKKT